MLTRDDISVCSAKSTASSVFSRRPSKISIIRRKNQHTSPHFRDDQSEYSLQSAWAEGRCSPLSLADHRMAAEGLQARRSVGEAIRQAQWERQHSETEPHRRLSVDVFPGPHMYSSWLGSRRSQIAAVLRRGCLTSAQRGQGRGGCERRKPEPRLATVFTWTEVESILLLPPEDNGPYLIVVTTLRRREDGSREWLLQACDLRARARWGIEICSALLHARIAQPPGAGFCGQGRSSTLSLVLFMDMVRVSCEAARLQPSTAGMERLVEVLNLLVETQSSGIEQKPCLTPSPPKPVAALKRFSDAVRRAHRDFKDWLQWWEVLRIVRVPKGFDADLWHSGVLPFLWPSCGSSMDNFFHDYPKDVESQLISAAERCHRTLCS